MIVALQIISLLASLGSLACFIMVLVRMFQTGKTTPAIVSLVGLLACGFGALFAFIYGWVKVDELRVRNIMLAWTVLIVLNILASIIVVTQTGGVPLGLPVEPAV